MNKIAITIDEHEHKIKILYTKKNVLDLVSYDIPQGSADLCNALRAGLSAFTDSHDILPASAVFVLPNNYAVCDYIEIPSFKGKKLNETLDLEIANRYKNSLSFKIAFVPINIQKVRYAYAAFLIRREHIETVNGAFKPYKFSSKQIGFSAATTAAAYLDLCDGKKQNVLFADIKPTSIDVVIIKDSMLTGFTSLPYGENIFGQTVAPSFLPSHKRACSDRKFDVADRIMRSLDELCHVANEKYNMDILSLKINVSDKYAEMLSLNDAERFCVKNDTIARHLELYGALTSKYITKDLLFDAQ